MGASSNEVVVARDVSSRMYTEVSRIHRPDPHVHKGDPNPVHTEVAKMAVFGSDICADLSGSCPVVGRVHVCHLLAREDLNGFSTPHDHRLHRHIS